MRAETIAVAALLLLPFVIQAGGGASGASPESPVPASAPASFASPPAQGAPAGPGYADLSDIVLSINSSEMHDVILWLQSFRTRYCLASNNGVVVDSIAERLGAGGAQVSLEPFQQSIYTRYNAVATIPGTGPQGDEIVVVCAHMDSITGVTNRTTWAPGADDNGSGTAALILMADILSQYRWNRTIKLCAFNAEELGLTGSEDFAADSAARGDAIVGAFNMDMIAYCGTDTMLDLAYTNETYSAYFPGVDSQWMADLIIESDAEYGLGVTPVKYLRGTNAANSDHYPFWQNGYDAVCVIEKLSPDYPYYHTYRDTVDKLDLVYAAEAARAVLGAVCEVAGINSTVDGSPPGHALEVPAAGGWSPANATVGIDVIDAGGVDASSVELRIDGAPVAFETAWIPSGLRVRHDASLAEETDHAARIRARDASGNWLDWNWTFRADSLPPAAAPGFSVSTYSSHVRLAWGASPSPDVASYLVFKSPVPSGFEWGFPAATKSASTLTHDDLSAATTLGAMFYAVRPVDAAGNVGPATPILGKVTTTTYQGWTMLGNPLDLSDDSLQGAFAFLGASWTEAQAYDAAAGEWDAYAKASPDWIDTLEALGPAQGFWLKVSSPGLALCMCGTPVMNGTIELMAGWNLVSNPLYSAQPASVALAGVPYDGLVKYDYFAAPYRMVDMGPADFMTVGGGYWVHVPADCSWTYAN